MLSPHDPDDRRLVRGIVQEIGADVGHTTLIRVGRDGPAGTTPHVFINQYAYGPDINLAALLTASAIVEPHHRPDLNLSACALVLPDRDIAYIRHGDTDVTAVPVGPRPHDDPATRQVVATGLANVMDAIHQATETGRPNGKPFLTIAVLVNVPTSGPAAPGGAGTRPRIRRDASTTM